LLIGVYAIVLFLSVSWIYSLIGFYVLVLFLSVLVIPVGQLSGQPLGKQKIVID